MAKAEAEVAKYESGIGLENLPKIKKPIPTGKSVDLVICAPVTCRIPVSFFEEAAKTLGWSVKVIDSGETPSTQQAAMQQTVTEKPDAVVYMGIDSRVFPRQLEELKAAGITTVAYQTADKPEPPGFFVIPGPTHYENVTRAAAAAAIVAGGENAQIGYANIPEFPIFGEVMGPEFQKAVAELCPECSVEEYKVPIASLGKNSSTLITNFVRSHPGMNVVVTVGGFTGLGLQTALKGAGIEGTKVVSLYGEEANYSEVEAGEQFAVLPDPIPEITYLVADSLARVFSGESPEPDVKTTAPSVIWTAENLPQHKEGETPPVLPGYKKQFEEIWGK